MRPDVVVFDLYGTLMRIDSLTAAVRNAGVTDAGAFVADWRRKQIEYAWCATLMDEYCDFDTLTARALDHVCGASAPAMDGNARARLAKAWFTVAAYDDVAPVLDDVRARGIPLCVLTNGVKASAEEALRSAGIRDAFDDVLSVDAVRAYKPHPRVYRLVTARFDCAPDRVLFVSSNGWDATGAGAAGFLVAWCNRAALPAETMGHPPTATLGSLNELPALLDDRR